jgi:HSP20 family protein
MLPVLYTNGTIVPASRRPANRLSSLFDTFFNDEAQAWPSLPLSMWEDEHNVYVEMDAPGVKESDVELTVHQGDLVIKGERKCERQHGGYDNRSYGRFAQRITLPSAVDAGKVEAKLANGVLSMTFPKSEAAKPRRITLKTE